VDPASQMKTFITTELPAYVDAHYPTIAIRERRAITGLSMGGHGAILAALERPTVFGAAASMSGAMELREIKGKYDAIKEVGDTMLYASTWEENSVTYLLQHRKISPMPDLMFDCGINDQFFNSNKRLHVMLSERKIPHTYIERPGGHSWEYWLNALPWHLQFFASYFARPVTQHTQIK
jgi:S-formylglutathione hydrolase FrmB